VLVVSGGVDLGHQDDPLVTGGGAEAAVGGADGGFTELAEFEVPVLPVPPVLPELPAGTVAVLVAAWCPGRALAT
jgi:hypothetical protein